MWFEQLVGFKEGTPDDVRANLVLTGSVLTSRVNGRSFECGTLEMPSLGELRTRIDKCTIPAGRLTVREIVGDVRKLHADLHAKGALFQVASQFNLLEMISPSVSPEHGIDGYEDDHTQGPACAIAAGAGTIFRNYFVPLGGQLGQTTERQIDCLSDVGRALGNIDGKYWTMRNGYVLPTQDGLDAVARRLTSTTNGERQQLRDLLRIGVQWHTEVTLPDGGHQVSQAYCSAMPVAYSRHECERWEPLARLVLEAAYEATLLTAALNASRTGNRTAYLTLLGGGAFGNREDWILDALGRALTLYCGFGLDVAIVSYGDPNPAIRSLIR